MQCKSLRDACREAYIERYKTFFTDPPQQIRWYTYATSSPVRLDWVVRYMNYTPSTRTLAGIALCGRVNTTTSNSTQDVQFYENARSMWQLVETHDEHYHSDSYQGVFYHAGASGRLDMASHLLARNGEPDDSNRYNVCYLFVGVVDCDHVEIFEALYERVPDDYITSLMMRSLQNGSIRVINVMLDRARLPLLELPRRMIIDLLEEAANSGYLVVLQRLCEFYTRFIHEVAVPDELRAIIDKSFLLIPADTYMRRMSCFVHGTDYKLPNQHDVFTYLAQEQNFPIPMSMICSVVINGSKDALRYIHEHHHAVSTWEPDDPYSEEEHEDPWLYIFTSSRVNYAGDDESPVAYLFKLDTDLRLENGLIRRVLRSWLEQATYLYDPDMEEEVPCKVSKETQAICILALDCLRLRGKLEWPLSCVDLAVQHGCVDVAEWLIRSGAPFDASTLLESAVTILNPRHVFFRLHPLTAFEATVCFLLTDSVCAQWTEECIETIAEYSNDDLVAWHRDLTSDNYMRVMTWIHDMGAPYNDSRMATLHPVFHHHMTFRPRNGRPVFVKH